MSSQTVVLPPTGTYVDINNRFRNINEPAYNFRCPPLTQLISGTGSFTVQVKRIVTQNFIPTIQKGKTDTMSVTMAGTAHTIVLQEGHYTIDTLVTALNAAFTSAFGGAGFLFTYDYTLQTLTLTVPATTFSFNSPALSGVSYDQPNLMSPYDRLLQMLGFFYVKNRTFTGPTTIVADRSVNLIPTNSLYVYINENLNVISTMANNPQNIATVPIGTYDYGETVSYETPDPRTFTMTPQMVTSMTVSVLDDYGTQVNVPDSTLLDIGFLFIPTSKSYD